jgi:nucleotide-binding universal stress UspA family protein
MFNQNVNFMNSILVPLDFSEISMHAIPVAASIAARTGATIILHHNAEMLHRRDSATEADKGLQYAENMMNKIANSPLFLGKGIEKLITQGITYEQLIWNARQKDVDLIVMGSHGNTPEGRHFIDSNIQRVLRNAPCPVMTIKDPLTEITWKKVLVPISFNENISTAFEHIRKFAETFNSTVQLLFVNLPDKFRDTTVVERQMADFTALYPQLRFEKCIYNSHELESAILEYAAKEKADYIALISHDHHRQAKYLISVTETIAYHASVPVISVPMRKTEPVLY